MQTVFLYIINQCPFSSAHRDGAFAIQFANGAVFAGCKHTSCGGGTQRWQELRERYKRARETDVLRTGPEDVEERPGRCQGTTRGPALHRSR